MIAAVGVSVRVGGALLVDDVSLELRVGEVLVLVGPNGAGKSTLLGALAGDVGVAGGEALLDGKGVGRWRAVEAARRRGVLAQQNSVSFPFDVRSVVEMGRAPWRGTDAEDEDDAVVASALTDTGVEHLADRAYPTLSGGEQARVALARVLAQRTPVILLDEPTAALDVRHQELVLSLAHRHASNGGGVLVVLHDLGLAAAHADRVAVLDRGKLVAIGPPAEVCTADLLSAVYRHPVEVFPHPRTGVPVVLPVRSREEQA
ncbi:heme ABC transporter ATP-binding protein [Actinokineospora cianjurensis]|uniref:Iron complex transport system ATP-binding protein n=1 Tax=Actinokineospora cianjurensis TaxID=585224 RepID=A0A421B1J9_9PSEU|nr:heme ABC transporter ATP-binding protein [Actinokineospora cianjurensis]RLK58222.1 iron complex transport system ATP-binding protein [Actinokineospora cianjurensis]